MIVVSQVLRGLAVISVSSTKNLALLLNAFPSQSHSLSRRNPQISTLKLRIFTIAVAGMVKTKGMNRNHNHGDDASSSSTMEFKSSAPWSSLNHDVLFLIMMQLGVVDILLFSRVCKSLRSLALSNRKKFMASRSPMVLWDEYCLVNKKNYCYMKDSEGRMFKTVLPHRAHMTYFGSTCGFLIMFDTSRHDFWLVNPIKHRQLRFPAFHFYANIYPNRVRAILVFSRSLSTWVFVITYTCSSEISFYVKGKREWSHVSSTLPILDLHAFKGKIYSLHADCCLGEMRLHPKPKLTLLETRNFPKPKMESAEFVSSGENLYIMNRTSIYRDQQVLELDFGKMKWVSPEKTTTEYTFFISTLFSSAAIKPQSWADPQTQYRINDYLTRDIYILSHW